ncbi:MAG: hypothetical protein K2L84_05890 [Muribaculaceae bacterium]|nr:hypothetical protein [Muribaculaceae bacterium]
MKRLLLLAALATSIGMGARIAETGKATPILAGVQSNLYNPILSPDGNKLLFSDADYSNLRIYDFESGATSLVCALERAGFDARFTPDGSEVIYISQTPDSNGRQMRQLHSYNIGQGADSKIGEAARFIQRPELTKGGMETRFNGVRKAFGKKVETGVRTEGSTLYITVNGIEKAYSPVQSAAGYLWEALSPDGNKVMFFAAGHGIVICDLNGNITAELGNYEAPVWYGNNTIVAMKATDDGHQYRSSQIVMLTADGSEIQEITRPESMTMFPTASLKAGKIVYNTIDGRLFEMTVKLINE